jgi:hypothetical protein
MSQNGRREFLTSAAAVAAALAACTAPARRAQAQACATTMYREADIVGKVARFVSDSTFRNQLITFDVNNAPQPTMADLTPGLVDKTLAALTSKSVTSVTVTKSTYLPLGEYKLVSGQTTPAPDKRWPVVLTMEQQAAGHFTPDWNKILLFVIPDRTVGGHDITQAEAHSAMCAHPFGM